MTQIDTSTQNRLPNLASKLHLKLTQELNSALENLNITAPQWQVLAAVIYEECDSPSAISSLLGIDGAAITRHLDTLERKGLIVRIRSSTDRRSVKLEPASAARDLAPRAFAAAAEVEARFLGRLAEPDAARLPELLTALLAERPAPVTTLDDWERS